ncbi:MAG: MlaD family protein [Bdellovibrionales bacterium]
MERRVAFVLVGLFSLVLLAGLAAFVLWVHKEQAGDRERTSYVINFTQAVNGLSKGSSVRYLGVDVGQVQTITLSATSMPPQVRILVEIDRDVLITQGDVATIKPSGITGVSFIDLRHDEHNTSPLPTPAPGELASIRSELSDVDRLLNSGTESAQKFNETLEKVKELFNDANLGHITKMLTSLDQATGSLELILDRLKQDVLNRKIAETMQEGRRAAKAFSETMKEGQDAANNFSSLSRTLQENPSQLIYPSSPQGVEIAP